MRFFLFPIGVLIIRLRTKNFSKPIDDSFSAQDIVNEAAYYLMRIGLLVILPIVVLYLILKKTDVI